MIEPNEKDNNKLNKSFDNNYTYKIQENLDISVSSSHESIFDIQSKSQKEKENKNIINNLLLEKKRKLDLTKEEKEERKKLIIEKRIQKYRERNDAILGLIDNIKSKDKIAKKDINKLMRLLAIDLCDTKKLNMGKLISQKKREIFTKLKNLSYVKYQSFWFRLTNKITKGNAHDINSGNIRIANQIYNEIIEERDGQNNGKNEKTVKEIIQNKEEREKEIEELDGIIFGYDISSEEDSLDSSIEENSYDDVINHEIKEDKKEKERYLKENEEKELLEKKEKFIDKEDEIEIFN